MKVGTHVSHYRLLRQLGEGGMGQVYLAEDALLGRHVALKFVRSDDPPDPVARRRLLHEAKAAASLDHPFICKIFEVGDSDDGPFIAMEDVEGSTLEARLASGGMRPAEAIQVAGEIGEALEAAHRHGIVHRDLKPSNVMLTADGHVKVMDFGIARRVASDPAATTQSATFPSDDVSGTLLYMSPEQVLGEPATPASDLFALGIVLYELLAGHHPFKRPTALASANAIAHELPAPLPEPDADTAGVNRIVQRLLAKKPSDRYGSAREAVSALRQVGVAMSRESEKTPRRLARWRSSAVVFSSLVLFVTVAVTSWLIMRPGPALAFHERDWIVIADLNNLTGDKSLDSAIDSALSVAIRQSRYVNVLPRSRIAEAMRLTGRTDSARLDEKLASEIAVREGARAVLAVSLTSSGGGYTIDARLVDPRTRQAVLAGAVQAAGKPRLLPALDTLATRIRQQLGESLESVSQQNTPLPMATTASLEALKLFVDGRRLAANDDEAGYNLLKEAVRVDPEFALAHADLGVHDYLSGNRPSGEEHFTRALALINRLTLRERLWIQAVAQDSRGNREAAVVAYRAYLARYPDDADAWYRLGWTLMATLRRPAEAVDAFKNVLRINAGSAGAYSNLATCYVGLNKPQESLPYYDKAFELRPAMRTATFLNHEYGFALAELDRVDDARRVFETMTAQSETAKQASGLRSLALLEMYRGHYRSAIEQLDRAILLNRADRNMLGELRNRLYVARAARLLGDLKLLRTEMHEVDRLIAAQKFEPWILSLAGRLHAENGDVRAARSVLGRIQAGFADSTALSSVNRSTRGDEAALNALNGEIALADTKPAAAIPLLEVAIRLDPDVVARDTLARAYAEAGRWPDAVRAYLEVLSVNSLGDERQEPWILAHAELADIHARQGDRDKARAAYERFLSIWKDADPELHVLAQAKDRLAALR